MSTTVDSRVVQMTFDNDQFERNVSTSLDTLDKLKDSLKFKDTSKGLENLNDSIKKVDTSSLVASVEKVSSGFSAMEVAAITAIANVTNRLTNAAVDWAKSMTIDQISDGFSKYEQELKSINTIMVTTGASIEKATEQMRKLSWYTDETSYSYSGMVENISKFTAQGIGLEEAVSSMQGIGNMAGYAGASVTDATHSMEGFAKAMAAGYMSKQNWRWIQTAHMETVQTKEAFIQAAEKLELLQKVGDGVWKDLEKNEVTVANFSETLKDKWLTSDVLQAAFLNMSSYSDMLKEFIDKYEELTDSEISCADAMKLLNSTSDLSEDKVNAYMYAMAKCGKKIDSVAEAEKQLSAWTATASQTGFEQAQMYRTFGDAVEATKEAVSSTWREIFSYLMGNAEDARDLWTEVGNTMYDVFVTDLSDIRDSMRIWYDAGGFQDTLTIFDNLVNKFSASFGTLNDVIHDIFPLPGAEDIAGFTAGFAKFLEVTTLSETAVADLKTVLTRLLGPIGTLLGKSGSLIDILWKGLIIAESLTEELLHYLANLPPLTTLLNNIGTAINGIFKIDIKKILSDVGRYGLVAVAVLGQLASTLFNIVNTFVKTGSIGDSAKGFLEKIFGNERYVKIATALKNCTFSLTGAFAALKPITTTISFLFESIASKFKDINSIGDAFIKIGSKLGSIKNSVLDSITNFIVAITTFDLGNILGTISDEFDRIAEAVSKVFPAIGDGINEFKNLTDGIKGALFDATDSMTMTAYAAEQATPSTYYFADGMERVAESSSDAAESTSEMKEETRDTLSVMKDFFSNGGISSAITSFGEKISSVSGFLKKFFENMTFGKGVALAFSAATVISTLKVSSSLAKLLSSIAGFNKQSTKTLGTLGKALKNFINVSSTGLKKTFKSLTGFLDSFKQRSTASIILAVGVAIGTLAASLLVLSKIPYQDLQNTVNALAQLIFATTVLAGVLAVIEMFNQSKGVDPKIALSILEFAASIALLMASLKMIEGYKWEDCWQAITILGVVSAAMTGFALLISRYDAKFKKTSLAILAFAVAVKGAIKTFVSIKSIEGFSDIVTLMLDQIKKIGDKLTNLSIEKVLRNLWENWRALAGLIGAIAVYNFSKAFAKLTNGAKDLGIGMLAVSASLFVLVKVLKEISKIQSEDIEHAVEILGKLVIMIAVMAISTAFSGGSAIKFAIGLGLMTVSMWSMIGMLAVLKHFKMDEMNQALHALGIITTMIDLMMIASHFSGGILSFLGITVLLGSVMASLVVIMLLPMTKLLNAAISLGLVIGAIAAALFAAKNCDLKIAASFLIVAGAVAGIAYALYEFATNTDGDTILNSCLALSAAVLVVSRICALLGKIGIEAAFKGAVALGGIFAVLVAAIGIVLSALGGLAQIQGFEKIVDDGIRILNKLGDGLGQFFGGIVSGYLNTASDLAPMAENLNEFRVKLSPFLYWCKGLDEQTVSGVDRFKEVLGKITSADAAGGLAGAWLTEIRFSIFSSIKDSCNDFFIWLRTFDGGIVSGAENFNKAMTFISEAMKVSSDNTSSNGNLFGTGSKWKHETFNNIKESSGDFFIWLRTFDSGILKGAEAFSSVINSISNLGGNYEEIVKLSENVGSFTKIGGCMTSYLSIISRIAPKDITTNGYVCRILSDLAVAAETVPNEGGWLGGIVGENNIGKFGTDMQTFGQGIKAYAEQIYSLSDAAIEKNKIACEVLIALGDASDHIPNEGLSVVSAFIGDNDLGTFAGEIEAFGTSVTAYAKSIQDIPEGTGAKSAIATEILMNMAAAASYIPEIGGLRGLIKGNDGYKAFVTFLTYVGNAIADFVNDFTANVDPVDLDEVCAEIVKLSNVILDLNSIDDIGCTNFAIALDDLGYDGVSKFLDAFRNCGTDAADAIGEFIRTIIGHLDNPINSLVFTSAGKALVADFIFGLSSMQMVVTNTGKNIVDGLFVGIGDRSSDMYKAGVKLAEEFRAGIEDKLQIKSPSRVMKEDGGYTIKGFIEGITSGFGSVKNVAIDLATVYEDSFRNTMGIHSNSDRAIEDGKYTWKGLVEGLLSGEMNIVNAANYMGNLIPEGIADGIREKMDLVTSAFANGKQHILDIMAEDGTLTDVDLAGLFGIGGDSNNNNGNDGGSGGGSASKTAEKTTKSIEELRKQYEFGADALHQFSKMYDANINLMDKGVNVVDVATYAISNLAATLYEEAGGSLDFTYTTQEELTKVLDGIVSAYNDASDKIKNTISGIDVFSEFNYEAFEPDIDKIMEFAKSWSEVADDYVDSMVSFMSDPAISEGIKNYVSNLGLEEQIGYAKMFANASEAELSTLSDYFDSIEALSTEGTAQIMAARANGLIDASNATSEELRQIVSQLNDGLAAGLDPNAGTSNAITACENILGAMKETLNLRNAYSISYDLIQNVADGLEQSSGISKKMAHDVASITVDELIDTIHEQGSVARSSATTVGEYVTRGMASGIESEEGLTALKNAVTAMCQTAIEKAEEALGVFSPSRVFRGIGQYIDLGLAKGIDDGTSYVEESTELMASATINSFSSAINKISDFIDGNFDYNPVIRPTLDLTDIADGASSIGSMLNANKYAAEVSLLGTNQNGGSNGANYQFIQNNYSPKSLSRVDIYRQTKNQFAMMKEVTNSR